MPAVRVITGDDVHSCVNGSAEECVDLVRRAYLTHSAGDSSNPHSSFLRFPHKPNSRIISLPAYLGGDFGVAGMKWIASFPDNTAGGIPRASAMLILNDTEIGYPFACLESSIISATRTAASAVLGAEALAGERAARRVGFIGTGLIAGHVWRFLRDLKWRIDGFRLYDTVRANADRFGETLTEDGATGVVTVDTAAEAIEDCDLVVLATVAGEPHISDPGLFAHAPTVLHLSLRDLSPEVILAGQNITDDVDHAVRERTSLHLTEQRTGDRAFVAGTIADVLNGVVRRDPARAAIYSPFGLGVLDLAIGKWVYEQVTERNDGTVIDDFFGSAVR